MFTRKHALVATLALAALASSEPCRAQDGRPDGGFSGPRNRPSYGMDVVITDSADLSPDLMNVVCKSLSDRMVGSLKTGNNTPQLVGVSLGPIWGIATQGPVAVGTNAQIRRLAISYQIGESDQTELDDEKKVRELWDQGRKQLEAALRKMQDVALDGRRQERDLHLQQAAQRREEFTKRFEEASVKLAKIEDESLGTPEQVQIQLAEMIGQLRQLRIERISITARREAIGKRVDELRHEAEKSANDDPVLAELQKIVELRETQYEITKRQNEAGVGANSAAEVVNASATVAAARIELLKAKRAATAGASGATITALNDELSRLIIQDAESKAKEDAVSELVGMLKAEASANSRISRSSAENALTRARREVDSAEDTIRELETKSEMGWEVKILPLDEVLPSPEPEKKK